MSDVSQVARLQTAMDLIKSVQVELAQGDYTNVPTGTSIQAAINAAKPGAILRLDNATYTENIDINKPVLICPLTDPPDGRITTSYNGPLIVGSADATVRISASGSAGIRGIQINNKNIDGDLIAHTGGAAIVDRCLGIGNIDGGNHRGILAHGRLLSVTGCYFDHIKQKGRDSCVIGGWDGTKDLTIDNCYLRGGSATVFFGGADSASVDRVPTSITITKSTLTWDPTWAAYSRKNSFELKAAVTVRMSDCILEYPGTGQSGAVIVITVRNQGGNAPWSVIRDVVIERCLCQHAGSGVQIAGYDTLHPSDTAYDLSFKNIKFTDIDPVKYGVGGKVIAFSHQPHSVVFEGITTEGQNLNSIGYFPPAGGTEDQRPQGLTLRNMVLAPSQYKWKIDAGGQGTAALQAYMGPLLTYDVTPSDTGAVGYPQG